jgi:hypothetical protein
MSSVASYNASNELPNKSPVQLPPHLALMPVALALSPCTIQTTLQIQPDLNATLLWSIANGLLQTIANCKADSAVAKKGYKDHLHHLEQHVLHYKETFNHTPNGYVLNNRQITNFHIPVGDGLYQEAKWIRLNNDGTVSGYTVKQGPNQQPYIIDLYATPNNSVDSPIIALPAWFQHMLTGPGGDFHILQTTMADTDDWGLVREITCYREIDDDITHLAVKVEEYQWDLEVAQANLTSCESCLMLARAAECVEPLCNVPRKMTVVCLGWKRAHGVQGTYVQGCPL